MEALYLLLIPVMGFLASASGGNSGAQLLTTWVEKHFGPFWRSAASRLPEIVWAIVIALVSNELFDLGWYAVGVAVYSYIAMELGHGNAFHDGTAETAFPDRWQTLDYIVRPITNRLGFAPRSMWYCRTFMFVKWTLIGLPIGVFAPLVGIAGAAAYAVGFRVLRSDSEPAEWLSGLCFGAFMALAIYTRIGIA